MTTIASPVFSQQLFATTTRGQTDKAAVQGFSQIFASMLSAELRRGAMGSDSGMMGTGGGATGDIYGAFFDQAISKVLARSPAMKPLNDMVDRELRGSANQKSARGFEATTLASRPGAINAQAEPAGYTVPAPGSPGSAVPAGDARGPLLLPPAPTMFAPILPPPTTLTEG